MKGKLNAYRQALVNFIFHLLDTDGNGVIEEHELSEYLKHTQMPGILCGNTSPIERKSRELIHKICGNQQSHRGINVTDLSEFYIDRGMFTTDDTMFKYEVLDDWLFSEELCDMYLRNEVSNITPESAALRRGDSMSRAASSPYLSRHGDASDSSGCINSRHFASTPFSNASITAKSATSTMHTHASRPTTQQRSGDLTWRGRAGLPRSLSEADPKDTHIEEDNRKTLDDSNIAYNPTNDSVEGQPVQAKMKQQQRALQVQEALLQHLIRTRALSYSRQTSEENKTDDPNASLNAARKTCDVYIEKNQSIEDLSPMVLSEAPSPRLGNTTKTEQQNQNQSFQQQQLIVQRMKMIMRQQQRDLELLQGDQSTKIQPPEVQVTSEKGHLANVHESRPCDLSVNATFPTPLNALMVSAPLERKRSLSPLATKTQRAVFPNTLDTDFPRPFDAQQGDTLEKKFQRVLHDKNMKIAELDVLIKGQERELKARQEVIQSQQTLIHTQQSMISRMQMLTIG